MAIDHTKNVEEIRKELEKLPEADRTRVAYYEQALNQFLQVGGYHAIIAFSIVGSELAAKADA